MDQPATVLTHVVGDDTGADHIQQLGHGGVKLARLECTVADTVEYRLKAMTLKKLAHTGAILCVEADNAIAADQLPLTWTGADDPARMESDKVAICVPTGDAGNTGDEQHG